MAEYKGCNIGPSDRKGKKYKAQCGDNPPYISGQAATELNPAHLLAITIVQGRKASKVAAKVVRITGHVNFGHAVVTNR